MERENILRSLLNGLCSHTLKQWIPASSTGSAAASSADEKQAMHVHGRDRETSRCAAAAALATRGHSKRTAERKDGGQEESGRHDVWQKRRSTGSRLQAVQLSRLASASSNRSM